MDGMFVPNITIGPPVVAAIRKHTRLPLDVHLMIADPDRYVETFVAAGADLVTVHAEACTHLDRVLQHIRSLVLLMTVNPGFGGQKFIPSMTDKIRRLRAQAERAGFAFHIQVDGGIGPSNVREIYKAGADVLVAGNSIYGDPDPAEACRQLRRLACGS
jgi:ribulose-phosphate 3-epimerase